MIGVSYLARCRLVLLIYAYAGTIPVDRSARLFAVCGLTSVAGVYCVLSETGFNERFKDHYLVAPQSIINMAIMLGLRLDRARSRRDVSVHPVRRVQFQLAAIDAAADRHGLDRDGVRPGRDCFC